ncbi:MAG: hypothetical protein QXD68_01020, partial [Thermoplasmatales archaeon]
LGFNERLNVIDSKHGVWRCHFSGTCSEVCPKGVDPALAIQLLKEIMTTNVFVRYKQQGATKGQIRKSVLDTS